MKLNLNEDWQVTWELLSRGVSDVLYMKNKQTDWLKAELPCDIHMPLIENGIIAEPLIADQCYSSEWVENRSWWFKKRFTLKEDQLISDRIEITFESLDAEADIWLNDNHLGHQRSAFFPFMRDVKKLLRVGDNELFVRVTSGLEHYSKQDTQLIDEATTILSNEQVGVRGDVRRSMVRKPQYGYGWDWGPRVATIGIMKNVTLAFIKEVQIRSVHAVTLKITESNTSSNSGASAQLSFELEVDNVHPFQTKEAQVELELLLDTLTVGRVETELCLKSGLNYITLLMDVSDAKLWWPNGMGDQPLYTVRASAQAVSSGSASQFRTEFPAFSFGIRTLHLNTDKLPSTSEQERQFTIVVNGVPVFSKGGNWIPADSIYARVTDEKYDTLIHEAKEANFNMLRIWGGGIYEKDVFYEKCNQYGILIWHDFMFSCGKYPDHLSWFREDVEQEINYQTRRLRNHCSLALWCGNNENHWGFDEWWIKTDTAEFYGGAISYNEIAPRIVQQNCPEIPYWNSSPYGGEHPNGSESGDRHHWYDCMMNEDMEKRITPEEYDKVTAKFVSEYGYIGPCRKSTIEIYHNGLPLDQKSKVWQLHNNTFEKDTVLAGINKHYIDTEHLNIDEYLLYAGLCQGLMYGYSLEAIRSKSFCSGALFWMYNDCWGEVGWTIIDYYLTRKISYYFVKRAFEPVKLILRQQDGLIQLTAINETNETIREPIAYGLSNFNGSGDQKQLQTEVTLLPRTRTVLMTWDDEDYDKSNSFYYAKSLNESSLIKPVVLRAAPFRSLMIPKAKLTVANVHRNGLALHFTITSDIYAHAVHFGLDEHLHLNDEYFDMLPNEQREIIVWDASSEMTASSIVPKSVYLTDRHLI